MNTLSILKANLGLKWPLAPEFNEQSALLARQNAWARYAESRREVPPMLPPRLRHPEWQHTVDQLAHTPTPASTVGVTLIERRTEAPVLVAPYGTARALDGRWNYFGEEVQA